MHIQPHSEELRKYIPAAAYFSLIEQQRRQSFIGMPLGYSNETAILNRIEQLEQLEEKGFVYFGEKNWLKSYFTSSDPSVRDSYDQWVNTNFREYLGLQFGISTEYSGPGKTVWHAELNVTNRLLGYKALKNPGFLAIDEIDIMVAGNLQAPHPTHVIKVFEFLHSLEYAVSSIHYQPKGGREISVTGIDVTNPIDPSRWELNVISDYGSEWDFTIVDGRVWGE